jgi:hypothetical protein
LAEEWGTGWGWSAKGINSVELPGPAAARPAGAVGTGVEGAGVTVPRSAEGGEVDRADFSLTMAGKVIKLDSEEDLSRADAGEGLTAGRGRSKKAVTSETPSRMRPTVTKPSSMNGSRRPVGAPCH